MCPLSHSAPCWSACKFPTLAEMGTQNWKARGQGNEMQKETSPSEPVGGWGPSCPGQAGAEVGPRFPGKGGTRDDAFQSIDMTFDVFLWENLKLLLFL